MSNQQVEIITLDDDETTVKTEHETVSLTPQQQQTTPTSTISAHRIGILVKNEPGSGAVKRRNTSEAIDAPTPKRSELNVVHFISSREDAEAVDIICSNFVDFSTLCLSKGFKLSIESLPDHSVEIKLTQTDPDALYRKAFQELDTLIKIKRGRQDVNTTLVEITKQLDDYKGKVDQLVAERNQHPPPTPQPAPQPYPPFVQNYAPPTSQRFHPPIPSYYLPGAQRLQSPSQNSIPSTPQQLPKPPVQNYRPPTPGPHFPIPPPLPPALRALSAKRPYTPSQLLKLNQRELFLTSKDLKGITENEELMKDIATRLSVKSRGTSANPFYQCHFTDKKKILLKYFKFIQSASQDEDSYHKKMCDQLNTHSVEYLFDAPSFLLMYQSREMRRKFDFGVDVVGTIHFLQFTKTTEKTFFLCMAIVDQRIVAWTAKQAKDDALQWLRRTLLEEGSKLKWDSSFKLVTDLDVADNLKDIFVHSTRKGIFVDNQKVVTWMKNNFKGLTTCIHDNNHAALPAIYNMTIDFMEKKN